MLPEPTFKNFGRRGHPSYGVYLGNIYIGQVVPTTPAPYPGRPKATYRAIPIRSDSWLRERNGVRTAPSRKAGARMIVEELRRHAYGRKLLNRIASDHALERMEAEA
jgi:hypothetical protein